jgi:hypothetical protein
MRANIPLRCLAGYLALLISSPVGATVLFADDFEYPQSDSITNHGWQFYPFGDDASCFTSTARAYAGVRSLMMDSLDDVEQRVDHFFSSPVTDVIVTALMYDDVSQSQGHFVFHITRGETIEARIGIRSSTSSTHYVTELGSLPSWLATTIPRTEGWHELAFKVTPAGLECYIDGVLVRTSSHLTELDHVRFDCGNHGYGYELGVVHFDDVSVETLGAESVIVDVKPGSCPNPVNRVGGGVVPVAIAGTSTLDAATIDPATVRLAGVAPIRSALEDVTSTLEPDACGCATTSGDGVTDLSLKFDRRTLVAALGDVEAGDTVTLTLTAMTFGGQELEGSDCIEMVGP